MKLPMNMDYVQSVLHTMDQVYMHREQMKQAALDNKGKELISEMQKLGI